MPWVKAKLRGQTVFARADASGALQIDGGRVEIRYKRNDGRKYQAGARNLTVIDDAVLADDHCGDAAAVDRNKKKTKSKTKKKAPVGPPPPPPEGTLVIYTDGACSGNPGPAGLGVVIDFPEGRLEISEYLGKATNNIAELTAVLRALQEIEADVPAALHTDSQYTIGVAVKGWKAKKNQELVADLRATLASRPLVRLVYVKGHAGIPLNERADELARLAVETRANHRTR